MVNSIGNSTDIVAANSRAASSSASFSTNNDFETFLRMLTTQLQNQDPLKPMESTEFAVQLATFSGVEQQAKTNSLLSQMVSSSGGGTLAQLSNWIGKEVRTTAPVWFSGEKITLEVAPPKGVDTVHLVAFDDKGKEVYRKDIGTGSGEVDWLGTGPDDRALADGFYRFRLESTKDGKVVGATDVPAYSKVTGAELVGNEAALVLTGGNTVGVSEVTAVRQ